MDNCTKEEVVSAISDFYRLCYNQARTLYRDEQAVQSATATMFINATKEFPVVKSWSDILRKKIAEIDSSHTIPNVLDVWMFHYRDLVAKYGQRMEMMIRHCVEERGYTPEQMEEAIIDYANRLSKEQESN